MQNLNYPPFFESLHRPYHQPLKVARWVCEYIESRKGVVKSSTLNLGFYIYLVNKLHLSYQKNELDEYNGLISRHAVDSVYDALHSLPRSKKEEKVMLILRMSRSEEIDKQIYSTYKAASYYVNLAKDKLRLIKEDNTLSIYGEELLRINSKKDITSLSSKESDFYIQRLLHEDFLLIISLCLFKRLEFRYKFTDTDARYFDFINKMYNIRHFSYNRQSIPNYNTVRFFWIKNMKILDKRNKIKKRILDFIESDPKLTIWLKDLNENFVKYENENFKQNRNYESIKNKFHQNYLECIANKKHVLDFVNLYDIKANMKISHEKFQIFLNTFYEKEKAQSHIFFSNIVSSIDRRKRFIVRGTSILKIKYQTKNR